MDLLHTNVMVVGGGTAGVMAAIAAAEEGAEVIIVEGDKVLGGTGIRASVHQYYYGSLGGLQNKVDRQVRHKSKAMGGKVHGFQPEAKRAVITDMVNSLGIRILYNAIVAEVIMERNRLVGAIIETTDSIIEIRAAVTIDCTGDGDVAYLAGTPYTLGREWDGAMHPYSMIPRFIDDDKVQRYNNFDVGWTDPTDVKELSRAYVVGRSYAWKLDEDAGSKHYTEISAQIGIRESRYIMGEYVLQHDDLVMDRRFDDVVITCSSHYDNHAYDFANESELAQLWVSVFGLHSLHYSGSVPYRCLIPLGVDGLLVACRALSLDRDAGIALRMQRDMHKLGEAAGSAAALCIQQSQNPRDLNITNLQQKLIARGVLAREALESESKPSITFGDKDQAINTKHIQSGETRAILQLIQRLGTEEEGKALWWIGRIDSSLIVPALTKALPTSEGAAKRGIAFALALHHHPESIPYLLDTIRRGDADKPSSNPRTAERWIAAFILMKNMQSPAAYDSAITRLASGLGSAERLYMLHYLIAIAEQLDASQRSRAAHIVKQMMEESDLGNDYKLWGSNTHGTTAGSMRWSLEMTAGCLLELIGASGTAWISKYSDDPRAHTKTASARILTRLKERETIHAHANGN